MKHLSKLVIAAILFTVVFISSLLRAQEQTLTDEQKEETVNNIGQLLIDYYVFADIGELCAAHLKTIMEKGYFDSVTDKKEFSDLLTQELQSISKDKHMRVRVERQMMDEQGSSNPLFEQFKFRQEDKVNNYGFRKVEMLDSGIGYIDLRGFSQEPQAFDLAVSSMKLISNSNAVIFDLRKNNGGNPEMIKFILSYFFEKPTHLNDLYWREGDLTEEFWTTEKVDGTKMSNVPLFVLTSSKTFSAGEEFTYNVQTQKRGVIIGEVTGGGANPGGTFPAGNGFIVFIPTGRAINPITKTNWEGVGIKPDIETPADDALDKALELAKAEAEKYKQKVLADAEAAFDNLIKNLDTAEELFNNNNSGAEEKVYSSLNNLLMENMINETDINMLGYEYLGKEKNRTAVAVFKFNTEKFPGSSNVWDSLGEAYMKSGDSELAITNYEKSLELDPGNENAKQMIAKMKSSE
jgi:C-terminal processing protease CtpA/Prc